MSSEQARRTIILKSTVQTAKHFCQTTLPRERAPAEASVGARGADLELAAYGAYDAEDGGADRAELSGALEMDDLLERTWHVEYGQTFEEEARVRDTPSERRVHDVTVPAVVARGSPPNSYTCYSCGKFPGADVQTPSDVFAVGYRVGGPETAIRCVVDMAERLAEGDFSEVIRRTAVCRTVRCMLAQNLLSGDYYEAWVNSKQRPQLEKGTDRKDQGLTFTDNIIFLRCLAVHRPRVVTDAQLLGLFQWVVMHSQFVQEREKRFIATAMAVAESPVAFGYKFADPQSFVNRMASFPRNYAEHVIFPHILRMDLTEARWTSGANCILETAMPKPYDVVYAFLCEDNWRAQGSPVKSGRRVHRVIKGAAHAALFTAHGFKRALKASVKANPTYHLHFADSSATSMAKVGSETPREMQKLLKLVSGSHKRGLAAANGVSGMPTCASRQNNSGVHPCSRYLAVFKAQRYTDEECDAMIGLFMDKYDDGNTVGFERQTPKDPGSLSKACSVLRPVEHFEPPVVKPPTKRRQAIERCTGYIALKKSRTPVA